jgi:hypothetical protein
VGEVFPGVDGDERSLIATLATLSRDDTLFHCARLNIIVSGPGDFDVKPRQEQAIAFACNSDQLARINAFAKRHGGDLP